jgi:hypothetical protein
MKIPWLNIKKLNNSSIEVKVFNSSVICFNEESKQQLEEKRSDLMETRDLICSENIGESSSYDNIEQYSNTNEHSVPKYILNMAESPIIVIPQSKITDENAEEKPFDSHLRQAENQIYAEEKIKNLIDIINIRVPVVVGEYKINVCLEEPIVFKERVLRIKDISNSITLQNCRFIPTDCSSVLENGTSTALKGKLLLEGLLHQDIEYTIAWDDVSHIQEKDSVINPAYSFSLPQTVGKTEQTNTKNKFPNFDFKNADNDHNYLEKICSMAKEISFSTMVEIDEFLRPLIVGDTIKNSFEFLDQSIPTDSHIHTKLLNEKVSYIEEPFCCLIDSEIHVDITLINHFHESKVYKSSSIFEQKIALEVFIHLLQVQTVRGTIGR